MSIKDIILNAGKDGKIFTVKFIKRTTGEERIMNCRLGVIRHVKGVGLAYNPSEYALLGVYDMAYASHVDPVKAYRMIDLNSVLEIRGEGKVLFKK